MNGESGESGRRCISCRDKRGLNVSLGLLKELASWYWTQKNITALQAPSLKNWVPDTWAKSETCFAITLIPNGVVEYLKKVMPLYEQFLFAV